MKLFSRTDAPPEFQVSCAADWEKLPLGFLRVISNGHESLAFRDTTFGILRDVKPVFRIGAREFRLENPISELPLVRVRVLISQPGVAHMGDKTILDTDKGMPDGVVEYEPSAL